MPGEEPKRGGEGVAMYPHMSSSCAPEEGQSGFPSIFGGL